MMLRLSFLLALACLVAGDITASIDQAATEKAHVTESYRKLNVESKYGALPLWIMRRGRTFDIKYKKDGSDAPQKWLKDVKVTVAGKAATAVPGASGVLTVTVPADAPIGRREIKFVHADKTITAQVIILFNPFHAGDAGGVFINDPKLRTMHATNAWGLSAQGSFNSYSRSVISMEFYTFLPFVLDVMEGKVAGIEKLADTDWDKPLEVARYWHNKVRSSDDSCEAKETDGMLSGCWDKAVWSVKGTISWPRMSDLVDAFKAKNKALEWGQCYVFGSLLTTMARATGIPARSITNFESCSPLSKPCGVVPNTRPWNFHVWNEFYVGDEWIQMDGTFAKDDAKVNDILNNNFVGNARYVADEVKALKWNQATAFKPADCKKTYIEAHPTWFDKDKCGALVVTTGKDANGGSNKGMEDRTAAYKGTSGQATFQPKLTFLEVQAQLAMRARSKASKHPSSSAAKTKSPELSNSGNGQATLEIKIAPAQPKLGDSITISAKRNDKSFYLDMPLKVKIFVVVTDYTKQPFAVAFSKVMDAHLGQSQDAAKAAVTLQTTDYVNYFALSPYFQVIFVYYNADGREPKDEHVLQHYEKSNYAKGKSSSVAKPVPGTGNEIEFFIEASMFITPPPLVVVPDAGQKEDVLKKLANTIRTQDAPAGQNPALEAFFKQIGVAADGIVDVHPNNKAKLLVLLPNPVKVPFTHVTLDIYAPGAAPEHVVVKNPIAGGDVLIFPLEVAVDTRVRGHEWPQFVTVKARSAEVSETTGQITLAVTGETPASPPKPIELK